MVTETRGPQGLTERTSRVKEILGDLGSVIVALSGGVDSSVLAQLSRSTLGEAATLAVIARSPSLPTGELKAAITVANTIGIRWQVIDTAEVEDERYAANRSNRCFFCRDELFGRLAAVAREQSMAHVVYGEISDDLDDHRPGAIAAQRHGVRAPLREAGMTKTDVRALARAHDLPVWDKPAMACLASRIPTGVRVTTELLAQIDRAEQIVLAVGVRRCRVRHHGAVARIEVDPDELALVIEHRTSIASELRSVGFEHVTIDLLGYRRGD
jgi:pyridinium-3,5-biscarboxylic acid mononucleotide sulfurtransferase